MDGWMDGWMDGYTQFFLSNMIQLIYYKATLNLNINAPWKM